MAAAERSPATASSGDRGGQGGPTQPVSSVRRLATSAGVGVAVGLVVWHWGTVIDGLLAAWVACATVFVVRCWLMAWPCDAARTREIATREDPGRTVSDVVLLWVAAVSMLSVVLVMFDSKDSPPELMVMGVLSIIGSWTVVHTLHVLRYARLYYAEPVGGLDFHDDDPPSYRDFAYLAVTVGITFQVSDTEVNDPMIRSTVMRHGLMSFGYSTVIIASTINIVAGLAK